MKIIKSLIISLLFSPLSSAMASIQTKENVDGTIRDGGTQDPEAPSTWHCFPTDTMHSNYQFGISSMSDSFYLKDDITTYYHGNKLLGFLKLTQDHSTEPAHIVYSFDGFGGFAAISIYLSHPKLVGDRSIFAGKVTITNSYYNIIALPLSCTFTGQHINDPVEK